MKVSGRIKGEKFVMKKQDNHSDTYTIHTSNTNERAELLGLECKNCGAVLELVDKTHAICPYCGQRYLIDEAKGTVINIQVDYSGNEEMHRAVNQTRKTLIIFLSIAVFLALIIFGFNIAARKSIFSSSDTDIPVDANGELLVIFCKDIFGKEYKDITPEELGSIRYLKCFYERENGETFNSISYSFTDYQDCEDEKEFQKTVRKWTYRTKQVSWPSDYTMFTGLTRIDTTDTVWLSLLHFSPESHISYVDTDDSLETISSILKPEEIKVLHIGIMGTSLEGIGQYTNLEELEVDTTLTIKSVDVTGLEECKHLKHLRLSCGETYTGLEKLNGLSQLTSLHIDHMPVGECNFLKELSGLEELFVYAGEEPELSVLTSLSSLKRIYFVDYEYIPLEQMEILKSMDKIEEMMVAVKEMECLEMISTMENLKALDLHLSIKEYQKPTNVSMLSNLRNLEKIQIDNFWGGEIAGLEGILNLPNLSTFRFGRTTGADAELLIDAQLLEDNPSVHELGFTSCHPKDINTGEEIEFHFLNHYPSVQRLYLDECDVADVSFVENMDDLRACSLKNNEISDLSPLSGCRKLEIVCADKESVKGLKLLKEVEVYTELYVSIYEYSIFD